jgi:CSLREA domain-containing protein
VESLENRAVPAVIVVNSLADIANPTGTTVTLRSAIQTANTNGAASNTIDLAVAGTYQLTQGELSVTAAANLTIQNTSHGTVIVDGGGISRVFDVNPSAQNTTPFIVMFQGITIQDGVAAPGDGPTGSGGGIRAQGAASIVLSTVTLRDNTATADGGAISLESANNDSIGTLTITNSTIENNHAGDAGGGVESDGTGTITINHSTIQGNTCVNQGAGVWLDAGTANLIMTGDIVSGNQALFMLGGGIGNAGSGNVTLIGCTIENNSVGSSLQVIDGTPTLVPGTGGGFADAANLGSLTVTNCLFLDNTAAGDGGAIQEGGPSTTITGTVFDGNISGGNGGGVFVDGTTATLTNDVYRHNVAVNGGAVEADATTFTAMNCTFSNNRAQGSNGGNGNNAGPGGAGGAVDVQSNGTNTPAVSISNSLFQNNAGNNGSNGLGGAINDAAGTLTVTACQFTDNYAFLHGGAIDFTGTTLTVIQSTFNGNSAIFGGAVFLEGGGTFMNDTFVANQAGNGGGAIEFINGNGALTLVNDTINGNTAGAVGGGLELPVVTTAGLSIQNTIIFGNSAFQGPDIFSSSTNGVTDQGGNLLGTTSGVSGFGPGTLVGVNPKLGPLVNNGGQHAGAFNGQRVVQTEALLPGSPAIGTGVTAGAPIVDERGFPRPAAGRTNVSIGAFEPQYAANATANQAYVESLIEVLLNRAGGTGAANLVSQLGHGTLAITVVQEIENTNAYGTITVQTLFQRYLDRMPTTTELQSFLNLLRLGESPEQLAAQLAGTAEFFNDQGGTNATFLTGLFETVLNRQPTTTELFTFEQSLAGGVSRRQIALTLLLSGEYRTDLVTADFKWLLGRTPTGTELAFYVTELQHGSSDSFILSQILSLKESVTDRA